MSSTASQHIQPLALRVNAEVERLPWLREQLSRWLQATECSSECAERLLLAMNEAVTNSIEHAYRGRPKGPVRVLVRHETDDAFTLVVSDDGRWRKPQPNRGVGGKGVMMMQECADTVQIDHSPSGTTVTIRACARQRDEDMSVGQTEGDHQLLVRTEEDHVVAEVRGDVSSAPKTLLRRQLLAATCGGLVPLTVDLSSAEAIDGDSQEAIIDFAHAAENVGGHVVAVVPVDVTHDKRVLVDDDAIEVVTELSH